VKQYGFKDAVISGLCQGRFMDEKQFWPIFEQANASIVCLDGAGLHGLLMRFCS
jgi:hypothetical protein